MTSTKLVIALVFVVVAVVAAAWWRNRADLRPQDGAMLLSVVLLFGTVGGAGVLLASGWPSSVVVPVFLAGVGAMIASALRWMVVAASTRREARARDRLLG